MKTGKLFTKEANWRRICFLVLLFAELFTLTFWAYTCLKKENINLVFSGESIPSREQAITLKRGIYRIDVTYDAAGTDINVQMHMETSLGEDAGDIILLSKLENQKAFEYVLYEDSGQVWISSDAKNGQGGIQSITICGTEQLEKAECFLLCCFFLFIDLLYLFRKKWYHPYSREEKKTALILIMLCILTSIPVFINYIILEQDITFHLMRIEGLAQGIVDGQFPVRIQPIWLNDYGYPVSVMYGDLLLYIPAFLRIMGLSLQFVYKIYVLGINVLTVLIAYYCAKEAFQSKEIGIMGALFYTLTGYRIVDLYYRCAVGEFTAMAFLPLVFLAFWRLFHEENGSKKKTALLMIVGFTGILQSHMLSMDMTVLFILLFCVLNAVRFWKNLRFLILTALVTIGLNLSFIVPMLDYMMNVDMKIAHTDSNMQSHGIFLPQLFQTFVFRGQSSATSMEGICADMPLGANMLMVFIVALFLWEAILYHEQIKDKVGTLEWKGQCKVFGALVLAILMSCYFFPWSAIQNLPLIGRILTPYQFAWRFLEMATVLAAILGCFAVRNLYIIYDRTIRFGVISLLCITAVLSADILMEQHLADGTPRKVTSAAFADNVYVVNSGEYLPVETQVDSMDLFYDTSVEPDEGVSVGQYFRYKKYYYVSCINDTAEKKRIRVPILAYKGYAAVDDVTGEHLEVTYDENRILQVILPEGYEGTVRISFEEPVYWRIAELVSLVMLVAVVIWAVNGKNSREKSSHKKLHKKKQEKIA